MLKYAINMHNDVGIEPIDCVFKHVVSLEQMMVSQSHGAVCEFLLSDPVTDSIDR